MAASPSATALAASPAATVTVAAPIAVARTRNAPALPPEPLIRASLVFLVRSRGDGLSQSTVSRIRRALLFRVDGKSRIQTLAGSRLHLRFPPDGADSTGPDSAIASMSHILPVAIRQTFEGCRGFRQCEKFHWRRRDFGG
ncbi:hypothetical protein GCM10010406_51770 [Streptomyces thermolineatus]|uniref:Transposase n=1 Tax=Streptomyces thermolineatus TaxID=44033 RepID=A0ABN3MU55_9ACTN